MVGVDAAAAAAVVSSSQTRPEREREAASRSTELVHREARRHGSRGDGQRAQARPLNHPPAHRQLSQAIPG